MKKTAMDQSPNGSSILSPTSADNGLIGPQAPLFIKVSESESRAAPQSPYSANRSHIQFLTPPPIPSMDIPPSPPGTVSNELNNKFQHFFQLKKEGVHFNEKLARSSALKNPGLLEKLMDFAGLDQETCYGTTLSVDEWNPSQFENRSKK